jgi:hypothetical protein
VMNKKIVLWIGALTLSFVSIVSAKSYTLVFSTPMQAGSSQLEAGTYKLEVEGSNAVFTNTKTRKSVTVPVKAEEMNTKFDVTSMDNLTQGSTVQINAIKLGGTKTKLEFGK